jgi:uncharacterized protein (UPF0332 family)/predicted nucleotidyltransferase
MESDKKPTSLGGHLNAPKSYETGKVPGVPVMPSEKELLAEFEKLKNKVEGLKKHICKKYKFSMALSILPGQAAHLFDEEIPLEVAKTKPIHLMLLIPEEHFKEIPKIKPEILKMVKETKENLWMHIWTPVDLWNFGLDSRFDFMDAIASSFPIYDNGLLGALRVASIHKSLLAKRFDRYIATYGIAGSLVRGTATDTSDVDTFVIIDDTDVKKMPRLELLERLRGVTYDYIREATALAGVKNVLNVQVWLLTEFWQNVKDAHPVMFTFIRDGIPLHDRGTFLPWKLLLQMGKIKPSPEAIDSYIKQGEQTDDYVKRRLIDAMIDVYYGVLTPSQALIMLYGEPPPTHKETFNVMKEIFVEKEKMMKSSDVEVLGKAVTLFKEYEHGKLKEIKGKEVDKLLEDCNAYLKKLKEVRQQIEKHMQKKTAEQIYADVFNLLRIILGNKAQEELIKDFEISLIKTGKLQPMMLQILKELVNVKAKIKAGKLNQKEVDRVKKDAFLLTDALVEYQQRKEVIAGVKGSLLIQVGKERKIEIINTTKGAFVVEGDVIKRIENGKIKDSSRKEFEDVLKDEREGEQRGVGCDVLKVLEKEFGSFEVIS